MQIHTRFWGDTEYVDEDIIWLEDGLFGFEEEKRYIIVRFAENNDTMMYLQSLENEQLGFIIMNPFHLLPSYEPVINEEDTKALAIEDADDVVCFVICVAQDPISESTVNMKCPIIINSKNHYGRQVILDNREYRFSQQLAEFRHDQKGEAVC